MHSIEGARGIAALLVVLMHGASLMRVDHFSGHIGLSGLFGFGYVGVDFFFVLSGFIITYVHFADIGKPHRIPIYLWRRLTRIYPIFWFCLALAVAVLVAGRLFLGKNVAIDFAPIDLLGTLLLVNVAEPKFLDVAWSLQFEIMFYFLFCAQLANRLIGGLLITAWAVAILYRIEGNDVVIPGGLLSSHSLQFIMGITIGVAVRKWDFQYVNLKWLILACISFIGAIYLETNLTTAHGDTGRIALGLTSSALLFCLVELEKKNKIKTPRLLYIFGSVSYSVYLSHIIFINVIYMVLLKTGLYHRLPEIFVFLIGVSGAIACAICIGFVVELPLVKKLKPMVTG